MTLASIQKIISVEPIEGADRIEKVKVLGWDCVVRKGIFKPNDLCIYIEIDTIIPKYLLDETYSGDEKVRLRTVKMKGQISQGLVLPINILVKDNKTKFILGEDGYIRQFDIDETVFNQENCFGPLFKLNDDITEYLGIKKYEKQMPKELQGIARGNFPSFIPKTDEIRIQSNPKLLDELKGKPYYITTKLDGTSATYYKLDGHFGVCSRKLELEDGDNFYWNLARKYNIETWLPDGYAIQGEICGIAIQKNRLNINGYDLFIFNLFDIKSYKFLDDIPNFDDATVGMYGENVKFVPVEETGEEFNYSLEELLERAKGNYESGNRKEGIVVRSLDQKISFKVVNNEYLLKDEE